MDFTEEQIEEIAFVALFTPMTVHEVAMYLFDQAIGVEYTNTLSAMYKLQQQL